MHWKAHILTEFDPFETALDRFVKLEKSDFIGKEALLERVRRGPARRLVTLAVDTSDAPAHGGSSVRAQGRVNGTVTSGDWGHRTGLNLAYAFVDPSFSDSETPVTVDIIGQPTPARVIQGGPYDPDHIRMRA